MCQSLALAIDRDNRILKSGHRSLRSCRAGSLEEWKSEKRSPSVPSCSKGVRIGKSSGKVAERSPGIPVETSAGRLAAWSSGKAVENGSAELDNLSRRTLCSAPHSTSSCPLAPRMIETLLSTGLGGVLEILEPEGCGSQSKRNHPIRSIGLLGLIWG